MRVIGVIDLKGGKAVHARGGSRELYEPVRSALLPEGQSGDATALARAYRDRLGLSEIYVADLDRISGNEGLSKALATIVAVGIPLMVDAGVSSVVAAHAVVATGARRVVVGLETLTSIEDLAGIVDAVGTSRLVFSLDMRSEQVIARPGSPLMGVSPTGVVREAMSCGITSVLVLDLARVGAEVGPAVSLVQEVRHVSRDIELIAGGGVRSAHDLDQLAAMGCDAALVGTALHRPGGLGHV